MADYFRRFVDLMRRYLRDFFGAEELADTNEIEQHTSKPDAPQNQGKLSPFANFAVWALALVNLVIVFAFIRNFTKKQPVSADLVPVNSQAVSFLKIRRQTADTLTACFTQMHQDDGIIMHYEEALEQLSLIQPDSATYFSDLADMYFSLSRIFTAASYLPGLLNFDTDANSNATVPAPVVHMQAMTDAFKRQQDYLDKFPGKNSESQLKNLYGLKLEFCRALDLYLRTMVPDFDDYHDPAREHQWLETTQKLLLVKEAPMSLRYITVMSRLEKLLFNKMFDLMVIQRSGPDMDPEWLKQFENQAVKMDSFFFLDGKHAT